MILVSDSGVSEGKHLRGPRVLELGEYFRCSTLAMVIRMMFRFQFAVAFVLALSAFCSASLFFWLSPPNGGKIELPTSYDSEDEFGPEPYRESDPFAVTRPKDFIDGKPIDEEKFWAKVGEAVIIAFLKWFGYAAGISI